MSRVIRLGLLMILVGLLTFGVAACGDGGSSAETVVIQGKEYTCEEIAGAEDCGPKTDAIFATYKNNIDRYVNEGNFADFAQESYENTVFAGLVACAYLKDDLSENEYIDFMLTLEGYGEGQIGPRVYFLRPWFEAQYILCPNLAPEADPNVTEAE